MSYTPETKPIARKDHRCIWCGQTIPKGERYVAERSVYDGDMQNHHWHSEINTLSALGLLIQVVPPSE